jgi:dihydrofolate reductase
MNQIVYYVASSIDGFISGKDEDISGFVGEGDGVERYLSDLKDYNTVIMGRKTYEFGYKYGLKPGQLAYPHMDHFIFSETLHFEEKDEKLHVLPIDIKSVEDIRKNSTTDIYLCGGGQLAGWLLDNEMIDVLKVKLNPLILGAGIKIFGNSTMQCILRLNAVDQYEGGLQIMNYTIKY